MWTTSATFSGGTVHRGQRADGLRDDRRMVALSRGVHHPEGQRGGLQGRAQPGPRERRLPLPLAPWRQVVRAHRRREARLLGADHGVKQAGRVDLPAPSCQKHNLIAALRHSFS